MSEIASSTLLDPTLSSPSVESFGGNTETVKVYTRHKRTCPKRERPDWARCNCMKWLYVYRHGKATLTSAKTRSWERAEQKARELRESFDPTKQLQKQLVARLDGTTTTVAEAVDQFNKEWSASTERRRLAPSTS